MTYCNLPFYDLRDVLNNPQNRKLPFETKLAGHHYFVNVAYDIGGYNWVNGKDDPRGFVLELAKGTPTEQELGAGVKTVIRPVSHYGKQQDRIAHEPKVWAKTLPKLVKAVKHHLAV